MEDQLAHIRAALERIRLTSNWPDAAVTQLCSDADMRSYRDGDRVVSAGDAVDSMWIITEGGFLLSRSWQNGRRFLYSYLRPGQMTGVLPVFDHEPVAFDVTARGDGSAIVVSGASLRAVAHKFPDVALEIIGYLCRRARIDYEVIELHAMNSVRCRIAKTILWFARGLTAPGDGQIRIEAKISQDDLADIVCAARQSVNRELRRLMREGIIKQRYRTLAILDRERLIRVAAEDEELSATAHIRLNEEPGLLYPATD